MEVFLGWEGLLGMYISWREGVSNDEDTEDLGKKRDDDQSKIPKRGGKKVLKGDLKENLGGKLLPKTGKIWWEWVWVK